MARDTHMWYAHFYDGQTAQPHTVQIEVLSNGLEIIFQIAHLKFGLMEVFGRPRAFTAENWSVLKRATPLGKHW